MPCAMPSRIFGTKPLFFSTPVFLWQQVRCSKQCLLTKGMNTSFPASLPLYIRTHISNVVRADNHRADDDFTGSRRPPRLKLAFFASGTDRIMPDIKKVVLAYSGGLDTSVILKWLQDTYQCEVVTFTADIGQGEEVAPARAKAKQMGVREIFVDDLREEFVRDFVYPMFRANAIYEGEYLLGTSIARPLIAKRQIE